MSEPQLSNASHETAPIQIQFTGEDLDYKRLSPVSKRRVAVALQMYLDYIFTVMAEVEPEVAEFVSSRTEILSNEAYHRVP